MNRVGNSAEFQLVTNRVKVQFGKRADFSWSTPPGPLLLLLSKMSLLTTFTLQS